MKLFKGLVSAAIMMLAMVANAEYTAGQHYKVLENPSIPRDTSKVEVVEIFWYGCPHCYHLEPTVQAWKKSIQVDVDFYQMPAQFSRKWQIHAQLFYVMEATNVLEKAHGDVFEAIHKDRKWLLDEDDQKAFLAQYGVSEADFDKHYDSFNVRRQLKMADQRVRQYQISGVPAVIVNGKYFVDASSAGGQDKIFGVVNYLIEQERKSLKK